jgi:cytochrome c
MVMVAACASDAVMAQDAANGEQVFRQCRSCHQIGPGAKNLVGPQLNGIVGRKVGTAEGFKYSPANQEAGAKGSVWTEEELFKYLDNPLTYMRGTRMAYNGLKDGSARLDLIAYLKKAGSQ